jgi:AcrR family transcriptional regulator
MVAKTASRQEHRRLKTRAALLDAGGELLAQRPIDAIAVNDIVDAAGVAKGSFFNHFQDKEAFAAAIAAEIRGDVESRVTAVNTGVADPAARMARAMCVFVQFALNEPKRARIMLRGHQWAADGEHPINAGLRADIDQGVATGRFTGRAEAAGVLYVIGLCQILMVAVVNGQDLAAAKRLAVDLLALTFAGLGLLHADAVISQAVDEIVTDTEQIAP